MSSVRPHRLVLPAITVVTMMMEEVTMMEEEVAVVEAGINVITMGVTKSMCVLPDLQFPQVPHSGM